MTIAGAEAGVGIARDDLARAAVQTAVARHRGPAGSPDGERLKEGS